MSNEGEILYKLLQTVIFLIPLGGLIWKAARQSGRIEEMEKDMIEITNKVDKIEQQNNADISEIKNSINALNISMCKIDTALQFITDAIKKTGE